MWHIECFWKGTQNLNGRIAVTARLRSSITAVTFFFSSAWFHEFALFSFFSEIFFVRARPPFRSIVSPFSSVIRSSALSPAITVGKIGARTSLETIAFIVVSSLRFVLFSQSRSRPPLVSRLVLFHVLTMLAFAVVTFRLRFFLCSFFAEIVDIHCRTWYNFWRVRSHSVLRPNRFGSAASDVCYRVVVRLQLPGTAECRYISPGFIQVIYVCFNFYF